MSTKVNIDCRGNSDCDYATIETPKSDECLSGLSYLWIGKEGRYFGIIEKKSELKKLKSMIDKIIKQNWPSK